MPLIFKEIQEDDYAALISLFREFSEFEGVPERMTNSVAQMKQEKELFRGFAVKNDEGEILGYTIFFFAYFTWTGKTLYMDDLYVRQAYRQQGIGSLLINRVIDEARKENCKKVHWQVSDWNAPARAFYERLGATIDAQERNCDLIL